MRRFAQWVCSIAGCQGHRVGPHPLCRLSCYSLLCAPAPAPRCWPVPESLSRAWGSPAGCTFEGAWPSSPCHVPEVSHSLL